MKKLLVLLLLFCPAYSLAFEYNVNQSLGLNTSETFTILANESADVFITSSTAWIVPNITYNNMNGSTNFSVLLNIYVPANTTNGTYHENLTWVAIWDNTSSSKITNFTFNIYALANNTNTTSLNITTQAPPSLLFIFNDRDGGKLQFVSVNITLGNFTASGISDDQGSVNFTNLTAGAYGYNAVKIHYYSENGEVTIGNESIIKNIILDYLEGDLANAIQDQVQLLQESQTTIANVYTNSSMLLLQERVANLETANKEKDERIASLTNVTSTVFAENQKLSTEKTFWQKAIDELKFKSNLKIFGVSLGSIFGTAGIIYLKRHWTSLFFW